MLNQYTNKKDILEAQGPIIGKRIDQKSRELLTPPEQQVKLVDLAHSYGSEIHLYSGENWVTGDHNIMLEDKGNPIANELGLTSTTKSEDPLAGKTPGSIIKSGNSSDSVVSIPIQYNVKNPPPTSAEAKLNNAVALDIRSFLETQKITSGNYKFVINFFEAILGDYLQQYLKVDEISPDRTEIRLKAISKKNRDFLTLVNNYINTVNQTSIPGTLKRYLVNFGRNKTYEYINSVVIGEFIYVKLIEPIPDNIEVQFKCWLVCENKRPYIDNLVVIPEEIKELGKLIQGPNWEAADSAFNVSSETNLKNWNDLLGSSLQTSQQLVDYYFSGSLGTAKLNIDYTDFNNFVFYSSAEERLTNFRYKLNLIEYYAAQSQSASQLSGSVSITNALEYDTLKNTLIGGFDDFENFLYYESSSGLFSNDVPLENATVAVVTGSYITPAPKSNSTVPFSLYSVSSSIFETWYNETISSASLYDQLNDNKLTRSVPEFILLDENSDQLKLFVNMLGQHYDILYTYISAMTRINKRDEHPKLGMPNELLYSVAKQFGWHLIDGNQDRNLWEYTLGTNEGGTPLTGSNSVGDPAVPLKDVTYNTWRRIVNNIPGLLKSKGTKRSIHALLACYGIPQSLVTIKEYGGPRLNRIPQYNKLNFDYSLDLINNPAGSLRTDYTANTIKCIELRFRLDNVLTNPSMPSQMVLYQFGPRTDSSRVVINFTSGTKGTLGILPKTGYGPLVTTPEFEMFDGGYINTLLKSNQDALEQVQIIASRAKDGKIVSTVSSSFTSVESFVKNIGFKSDGQFIIGNAFSPYKRLKGQVQELRFWSSELNHTNQIGDLDNPFINHTKAPAAYDGNVDSYDELLYRLPLTERVNHAETGSLIGVQPVANGISSSFGSWSTQIPYDSIEEIYYYDGISLGAGTFDDNKVRIEDNELIGVLDFQTRAERSQFDKAALDIKKLGVYFSPQTMINEDIIAQLGFTMLDDYIGDPGDLNSKSYPDLKQQARQYWKKYNQKNDLNAYIKIFSLFDLGFFKQLDQLLPARADKLTGLLIQPNILERNKDTALPLVDKSLDSFSEELKISLISTASNNTLLTEINRPYSVTGADDDQLQILLTSSDSYESVPYFYETLIRTGGEWKPVLTPSWTGDALLPSYTGSRFSEFFEEKYIVPKSPSLYHHFGGTNGDYNINNVLPSDIFTVISASIDPLTNPNPSSAGVRLRADQLQSYGESSFRTKQNFRRADAPVIIHDIDILGNRFSSRGYVAGVIKTDSDNKDYSGNLLYGFMRTTTSDIAVGEIAVMPYDTAAAGGTARPSNRIPLFNMNVSDEVTATIQIKADGGANITFLLNGSPVPAGTTLADSTTGKLAKPFSGSYDWGTDGNDSEFKFGGFLGGAITQPVNSGVRLKELNIRGDNYLGYRLRRAQTQDFLPAAQENVEYEGCKMTSPDFNIDSLDTIDGGPVAEIFDANPNQIIVNTTPTNIVLPDKDTSKSSNNSKGGRTGNISLPNNDNLGDQTTTRTSNRNTGGNNSSQGGNFTYR